MRLIDNLKLWLFVLAMINQIKGKKIEEVLSLISSVILPLENGISNINVFPISFAIQIIESVGFSSILSMH